MIDNSIAYLYGHYYGDEGLEVLNQDITSPEIYHKMVQELISQHSLSDSSMFMDEYVEAGYPGNYDSSVSEGTYNAVRNILMRINPPNMEPPREFVPTLKEELSLEEKLHEISDHRGNYDIIKNDAPTLYEDIVKDASKVIYLYVPSIIENFEQTNIVLQKIFFGYAVNDPDHYFSGVEKAVIELIYANYKEKINSVLDET